jgi:hypothetical protein
MTLLSRSLALALAVALAASTALAQTPPQPAPAKPGDVPQAGQSCPNGWMMARGQMMGGQPGQPGGGQGPGGRAIKPGTMMPNGMMMGRDGAYCTRQAAPAPDNKGGSAPPAK